MCVEFCWCLCIHKVSFRGACYFFASVNGYEGVSRLLRLIFTNVLLRTYFIENHKTDLDMVQVQDEAIELFSKSSYYLATTVTALLIFRAVEKEWRQLLQWAGLIFLLIESIALGMYFVLHPQSYSSASCLATLSSRIVFVIFYFISIILYIRQLVREEKESEWKFQQSEWEPRFLNGRSPGYGGLVSGFGSLGFGENTIKWLESSESKVIPHPKLVEEHFFPIKSQTLGKKQNVVLDADGKFDVRYEVCKSTTKLT